MDSWIMPNNTKKRIADVFILLIIFLNNVALCSKTDNFKLAYQA
jgi:hypothetical protein